jgi:hypothetical protein
VVWLLLGCLLIATNEERVVSCDLHLPYLQPFNYLLPRCSTPLDLTLPFLNFFFVNELSP